MSNENILIYDVFHKNLIDVRTLHVIYNKVDGFIKDYGETICLFLFGVKKYNFA